MKLVYSGRLLDEKEMDVIDINIFGGPDSVLLKSGKWVSAVWLDEYERWAEVIEDEKRA